MRRPLLAAIRAYQRLVSPMLGLACRYEPSCSHYAYEAIERHGAWRGVRLAASRLSRCRPGGGGGYDPVPGVDVTGADAPSPGPSEAPPVGEASHATHPTHASHEAGHAR